MEYENEFSFLVFRLHRDYCITSVILSHKLPFQPNSPILDSKGCGNITGFKFKLYAVLVLKASNNLPSCARSDMLCSFDSALT